MKLSRLLLTVIMSEQHVSDCSTELLHVLNGPATCPLRNCKLVNEGALRNRLFLSTGLRNKQEGDT
jgi:hypothetical protein